MALKGDLASVDLAQVFQMLALNQKVGLLGIQSPTAWKALYFDPRGVTYYYNEHLLVDGVLATMIRTGTLLSETVQDARDHAASTGTTVIDSLLAGGYLTEADLDHAFRREIEEEIYDLFFWRDARFEFFEHASTFEDRDGVINERYFFSTDTLIMEAARRIDEWSFIQERVPSAYELYKPVPNDAHILDIDDTTLSVYELVDGKRNVERLIEVTGLAPFHVYKHLALLLDQGMIGETAPEELVPSAQECVAEGRLQDAINLYEKAISIGEGLPESHSLAAQAYEAIQEFELATYHLKCVAEYYTQGGQDSQAVEILRHVIRMIPTDLEARERLIELTVGNPEFKGGDLDAVAEGKLLVDLYLEIGEIDRVRGILERLLRDNPGDLELKKSLVNVHTKAGDTRRVIELYESIADDLVRHSQPIEAVKYLQKILMIDRSRKDVSERIRSLYELDERRRNRRRSLAALGSVFLVIAALAGVWYFYEQHAREHFERIDVSELCEAKEFRAAIQVYDQFIDNFPLTLVARQAESARARVQSLKLAHEAELKQKDIAREAELKGIRAEYRMSWEVYQVEFRSQNLDAALAALERVREKVQEAGDERDLQWARQVQLEKNRRELREYLSNAMALDRAAREHMRSGNWSKAREVLLQLTSQFEMTRVARNVQIPVEIRTKPNGATIFKDGRPLTRAVNGETVELRTPAWVFCERNEPAVFKLQLDGFKSRRVTIDPLAAAQAHYVLTVVPRAIVQFEAPLQTPIGVGNGHLVVGLRGGRVGIARTDKGIVQSTIQLGGLREPEGEPVVAGSRVFFATNEGKLACHEVPSGTHLFTVPLESAPNHPPVVRNGRMFFGDQHGQLVCMSANSGMRLWSKVIDGGLSGRPVVHGRFVRVGARAGMYLVFDAANGDVVQKLQTPAGMRTEPLLMGRDHVVFGTADGEVVCMHERRGRAIWRVKIGRSPEPGDIALSRAAVIVVASGGVLRKLDASDGSTLQQFKLPGRLQSGPVPQSGRIYLTVREEPSAGQNRDLLLALDDDSLEVVWEFREGGTFRGPVTTDGSVVYLPSSKAEVLCFK